MEKLKYFIFLHMCILLFSMTEVFGKFAAIEYNEHGLYSTKVYVLLFTMLCVCLLYAFCWQKIIKHFDLHIAYANRSMYLVWSQIWAAFIFSETVTFKNIFGMLVVMSGVIVIALGEQNDEA